MKASVGSKISLAIEEVDDVIVEADPHQLSQVIMNRVLHARNSIEGNGQITVRATRQSDVAVTGYNGNLVTVPTASLVVSDDGKGTSNEELEALFEPSYSATSTSLDSGLGLAVAYGIVKQHGRTIALESRPYAGSRFEVFLPLANRQ